MDTNTNNNQVRNTSTFQHPILALRNGQPVRLLAIGDQEGKSPVYLVVDGQGNSVWESVSQVRIIDTTVIALPTQESLANVMQGKIGNTRQS